MGKDPCMHVRSATGVCSEEGSAVKRKTGMSRNFELGGGSVGRDIFLELISSVGKMG